MESVAKINSLIASNRLSQLVDYVKVNGDLSFKQLITIYIGSHYRISQRAAVVLTALATDEPRLLKPHYNTLLDALEHPDCTVTVKRNTIRLFQFVPIPARHRGRICTLCFGYLNDHNEAIAVRVFSMTVLEQITRGLPELRSELRMILEDLMPYAGPALRSRGAKVIKALRNT